MVYRQILHDSSDLWLIVSILIRGFITEKIKNLVCRNSLKYSRQIFHKLDRRNS